MSHEKYTQKLHYVYSHRVIYFFFFKVSKAIVSFTHELCVGLLATHVHILKRTNIAEKRQYLITYSLYIVYYIVHG